MSEEIIPAHEIYRAAKKLRQAALQFSPPYEFEGTEMVLVPRSQWEKLGKLVEMYEQYWFGEKIHGK